ncbi:YdgA family protein [Caulobacter soli]|nr:YdgA family protein [Caulobacter soli]
MLKKILIVVGCVVLALGAYSAWSAYSAKQRFNAVLAEHDKAPKVTATRN